jgi:hypothetical protein
LSPGKATANDHPVAPRQLVLALIADGGVWAATIVAFFLPPSPLRLALRGDWLRGILMVLRRHADHALHDPGRDIRLPLIGRFWFVFAAAHASRPITF